ncbi:MAG TPA: MarC family protein [Rubrobacteraceae bacterium]|nr:MarC family protein [Rubrobacteraceae bacterium]
MFEFVFNAFVTLLVVIDPLGMAPIFAALTNGFSEERKRESAIRGTFLGAAILFVFALVGNTLLHALGIGLPAFRIAGGILLFLLSLDMIFARPSGMRSSTVREQEEESYQQDISVFPLAIPLLAGPGGITTVLLYTGGGPEQIALFLAVLLVVLLLTLISLLIAPRIMRLFGETGANVLSRVLGVLLAALAVQFVLDGIHISLT